MKFTLIGFIAALGITTHAHKYYSGETTNQQIDNIITNYGRQYSRNNVGLGENNQWVGENNKWLGDENVIQGSDQYVVGNKNYVKGKNNNIKGNKNKVSGQYSKVEGQNNRVNGSGNIVVGSGNIVNSLNSDVQLNTDDWFPDWMKDNNSQSNKNQKQKQKQLENNKFSYSKRQESIKKDNAELDMNFPSWFKNQDDFWKTPLATSKRQQNYQSFSYNPYLHQNVFSHYHYPYSTSYYSQPSYYSPWSGWQQWYQPRSTQAYFYSSYPSYNRYYSW